MTNQKLEPRLPNYIRIHRRRTGLSQRELAQVLGYPNAASVRRHEHREVMPPLQIAIGYELLFRTPVSELFAGLRDDVEAELDAHLDQLEEQLGKRSIRDRDAMATARKLTWLAELRNSEETATP